MVLGMGRLEILSVMNKHWLAELKSTRQEQLMNPLWTFYWSDYAKKKSQNHFGQLQNENEWLAFNNTWPKQCRKDVSTDFLTLYKYNPIKTFFWFIIVDETLVHQYWGQTIVKTVTAKGEPIPKKAMTIISGGTVATTFWDAYGVTIIDFLEKGKQFMETYCIF